MATPLAPAAGTVKRYPVSQPDGNARHQLILVTSIADDGAVRGVSLGYEDQAAHFRPEDFADE
jgi:hypothetical protein